MARFNNVRSARPGVAQVISFPIRGRREDYDIRSALAFVLLTLAVSFTVLVALALALRSGRDLAGAFLPGLTWW